MHRLAVALLGHPARQAAFWRLPGLLPTCACVLRDCESVAVRGSEVLHGKAAPTPTPRKGENQLVVRVGVAGASRGARDGGSGWAPGLQGLVLPPWLPLGLPSPSCW